MINGVKPSLAKSFGANRSAGTASDKLAARGADAKSDVTGARSFAEQLVSPDRTERDDRFIDKPGREDRALRTNREGARSDESDSRTNRLPSSKQETRAVAKAASRAETKAGAASDRHSSTTLERPASDGPRPNELKSETRGETPRRKIKTTSADPAELRDSFDGASPSPSAQQVAPSATPSLVKTEAPREEAEAGNEIDTVDELPVRDVGVANAPAIPLGTTIAASTGVATASRPVEVDPGAMPSNALSAPIAEALEEAKQEQGEARRTALQTFMSNMQSQFGIAPEKIVDAFSKMDEKTLMAPPEESTKDFLANLQLPADQQMRAADLYKQMVRSTGDAALNEKLIGLEQRGGVNVDVLSPRDQALMQLNTAIDQLNNSFAMRGQPAPQISGPFENQMKAQMAADQMSAQLMRMQGQDPKRDEESGSAGAALMGASSAQAGSGTAAIASAPAPGADGLAGGLAGTASAMSFAASDLGSSMSNGSGLGQGANGGATGTNAAESRVSVASANGAESAKSNFASAMKNANSAAASEAKIARKGDAQAESFESAVNDPSALAAQTAAPVQAKPVGTGPAGMILGRPSATAQDEQDNVKELVRQAQLAVKKGGGEIKMDLKPEGIGQVHLKVSVENGQVNVQMLTQNDEAKRVLEKGLHELKSSLAAHQLKVENLKVDVGTDIQKQMDKGADDQGRQQMREFAQDVMSNLRDERQAMQQGFMENRGWRQYPQNRARDGVQSETATTIAAASATKRGEAAKRAGQSRLDLVA